MRERGIRENLRVNQPPRIASTVSVRAKPRRAYSSGSRMRALPGMGTISRSPRLPAHRDSKKASGSLTPSDGTTIAMAWAASAREPTGSSTSEATSACNPSVFSLAEETHSPPA